MELRLGNLRERPTPSFTTWRIEKETAVNGITRRLSMGTEPWSPECILYDAIVIARLYRAVDINRLKIIFVVVIDWYYLRFINVSTLWHVMIGAIDRIRTATRRMSSVLKTSWMSNFHCCFYLCRPFYLPALCSLSYLMQVLSGWSLLCSCTELFCTMHVSKASWQSLYLAI